MAASSYRAIYRPLGAVGAAGLLGMTLGGAAVMLAVLYGGGVAIVNAALLLWRWQRGASDYHVDIGKHLRAFRRSSLERFFVVSALLALGFVPIGLHPAALLTGFLIGQLTWMLASLTLSESN